jgi:hypothetical protein
VFRVDLAELVAVVKQADFTHRDDVNTEGWQLAEPRRGRL